MIGIAIWESFVGCIALVVGTALQRLGKVGIDADILTMRVSNFLQSSGLASEDFAHFVMGVPDSIPPALVSLALVVLQPGICHYCLQMSHHLHCQNWIVCVGPEQEHSDLVFQMDHIAQEARSRSDRAGHSLGKTSLRCFVLVVDLVVKWQDSVCPR